MSHHIVKLKDKYCLWSDTADGPITKLYSDPEDLIHREIRSKSGRGMGMGHNEDDWLENLEERGISAPNLKKSNLLNMFNPDFTPLTSEQREEMTADEIEEFVYKETGEAY